MPLGMFIKRGIRERCPRCGQGKLYSSYLKPVETCAVCGEDLSGIRADDGPAWLTILIVCHIVVPLLIALQVYNTLPDYIGLPLWLGFTVLLTLAILPRAKGVFIAVIWRQRRRPRANRAAAPRE